MIRPILLSLLIACSAWGQDIGGLNAIPPLTEARFPVRGLSVPDGSLDDLSKWASKLVVAVDSPDGATPVIDFDIGVARRQPVLYFSADTAGLYVLLVVDPSAAKPVIVSKRVVVGDLPPNPLQPGPVTPSTPATKALRATYVYEKSKHAIPPDLTALFRELIQSGDCSAASVDQDVKTGDGKTPKQYEVAISKAKEAGLPCVVVEYASGAAVVVRPTPDAVRKAVKP